MHTRGPPLIRPRTRGGPRYSQKEQIKLTTKKTKRCCGTSVGVIITDSSDRLLMVTRGWWPKGTAPVAGHVRDSHTSVAAALVAEVQEEVGLTVTGDRLLWEGHLPKGQVVAAPGETKGAAWYDPDQVHAMAETTLAHYRAGGQAAHQPDTSLEAVWLRLLHEAERLELSRADLAVAESAYTTPPDAYWLGGRP
jgi:ADP-ribose pyrophosphatase YjhB (NUDIX family)